MRESRKGIRRDAVVGFRVWVKNFGVGFGVWGVGLRFLGVWSVVRAWGLGFKFLD